MNGNNNSVTFGSNVLGLDELRRPCPTVYDTAVIFKVLLAAFDSSISYGHADKTHGVKMLAVNHINDKLYDNDSWIKEEGDSCVKPIQHLVDHATT